MLLKQQKKGFTQADRAFGTVLGTANLHSILQTQNKINETKSKKDKTEIENVGRHAAYLFTRHAEHV